MTKARRIASSIAIACAAIACERAPDGDATARRTAQDARRVIDSLGLASGDTVYQRRVADLARRARLVPIDSTVHLLVAIPRTPDSSLHVIRQAYGCQGMILLRQHGAAAWQRALNRVTDSLVAAGFAYETEVQRMEGAPGPPLEFSGPNGCGGDASIPPVPDSLAREPFPMPRKG
jgi:hypothetical protein